MVIGYPLHDRVRILGRFQQQQSLYDHVLLTGHKPSVQKGTKAIIPVENDKFTKTKDDWDCRIDPGTRARDLVLQVSFQKYSDISYLQN